MFIIHRQDTPNNEQTETIDVVNKDETVYTALLTPEDHYQELNPIIVAAVQPLPSPKEPEKTEIMNSSDSLPSLTTSSTKNYLTMTGMLN